MIKTRGQATIFLFGLVQHEDSNRGNGPVASDDNRVGGGLSRLPSSHTTVQVMSHRAVSVKFFHRPL